VRRWWWSQRCNGGDERCGAEGRRGTVLLGVMEVVVEVRVLKLVVV